MTPRDKSAPRDIEHMSDVTDILTDVQATLFEGNEDAEDKLESIRNVIAADEERDRVLFEELTSVIAFLET